MGGRARRVPPGVYQQGFLPPEPVEVGVPSHAEDDLFWDGSTVYRPVRDPWGGSESKMLRAVDVMVENREDCCPGSAWCGSLRVLPESQRRTIAEAGFVRFAEGGWRIEPWEADDGRTLALLVGEISRPRLR